MKQLNFLPDSVRHKAATAQLVPYAVIAVLIAGGLVGSLWTGVKIELSSAQHQLTTVQGVAQTVTTTPTVQYNADTIERITDLNQLSLTDTDWSSAYTLVQSIVPDAVTLSSFTYSNTANGMDLKINGNAPSNVVFASFVESVQADTRLVSTTVTSYSFDPSTGAVAFALDATVPFSKLSYPS